MIRSGLSDGASRERLVAVGRLADDLDAARAGEDVGDGRGGCTPESSTTRTRRLSRHASVSAPTARRAAPSGLRYTRSAVRCTSSKAVETLSSDSLWPSSRKPPGMQALVEHLDDFASRGVVEVDQHVAAEDGVDATDHARALASSRFRCAKWHIARMSGSTRAAVGRLEEVALRTRAASRGSSRGAYTPRRASGAAAGDVVAEHAHVPARRTGPTRAIRIAMRVDLFAGRAARAPDRHALARAGRARAARAAPRS